jgi:hypothetical protein
MSRITVGQDRPIETTDWADVQYKFGNKVGKYADPAMEQQILEQRLKKIVEDAVTNYDPNDHKTLEQIEEELEDSYDDDGELERLRQKRIAELKHSAAVPTYGRLRRIERADYVADVTNAGPGVPVVLLLLNSGHAGCQRLRAALEACAARFPRTKFLEITSTECIPDFPDKQLPCVILYRDGSLLKQLTGLNPWGGERFTEEDVAYELQKQKVVVDTDAPEEAERRAGALPLVLKS